MPAFYEGTRQGSPKTVKGKMKKTAERGIIIAEKSIPSESVMDGTGENQGRRKGRLAYRIKAVFISFEDGKSCKVQLTPASLTVPEQKLSGTKARSLLKKELRKSLMAKLDKQVGVSMQIFDCALEK
jgi:hypothetical protein